MNHEQVKRKLLQNPKVRAAYEHPPLQVAVAHAVIQRRQELNMTQVELSQLLGTSQAHIWRIESGQSNLTLDSLQKLADALQLSVKVIFGEPQTSRTVTNINISPLLES